MYVDAATNPQILGVVIAYDERVYWTSVTIPGSGHRIELLEAAASCLGTYSAAEFVGSRPFYLLNDNTAAESWSRECTGTTEEAKEITRDMWMFAARACVAPWVGRVRTDHNPADIPTRPEEREIPQNWTWIPPRVPPSFATVFGV